MAALKALVLLGLIVAALAVPQGDQQLSLQSSEDANQLVDQLLQSADQQLDSAQLQQVQIQQRIPDMGLLQLSLSQGQLSGIVSQASRSGQSQLQQQGQITIIQAPLQWSQLQVQYQSVQIQAQPRQDIDAQQLLGTLRGVRAVLVLRVNQQSGQLTMQSLQVQPQQPQQASLVLEGAEPMLRQYPQLQNQIARQVQQAAAQTLRQQVQQIVQQSSLSSK